MYRRAICKCLMIVSVLAVSVGPWTSVPGVPFAPAVAAEGPASREARKLSLRLDKIEEELGYLRRSNRDAADLLSDIRLVVFLLLLVGAGHLVVVMRRPALDRSGETARPISSGRVGGDEDGPTVDAESGSDAAKSTDASMDSSKAKPRSTFLRWAVIQGIVLAIVLALFAVFVLVT